MAKKKGKKEEKGKMTAGAAAVKAKARIEAIEKESKGGRKRKKK